MKINKKKQNPIHYSSQHATCFIERDEYIVSLPFQTLPSSSPSSTTASSFSLMLVPATSLPPSHPSSLPVPSLLPCARGGPDSLVCLRSLYAALVLVVDMI